MHGSFNYLRLVSRLALVVASSAATARANLLLTNPDFESTTPNYYDNFTSPAPITGWVGTSPGGYGYFGVSNDGKAGKSGDNFVYIENAVIETASVNRPAVTGGTAYGLSAVIRGGDNTAGEIATLSLVFYDASGASIPSATSSNPITVAAESSASPTPFSTYSLEGTAPANAASVAATFAVPYPQFSGHTVFVDNFQLNVVPEPAFLSIGAFAIAGLGRRRRSI